MLVFTLFDLLFNFGNDAIFIPCRFLLRVLIADFVIIRFVRILKRKDGDLE